MNGVFAMQNLSASETEITKSREFNELQYSPSRWAKRMAPEKVVQYHVKTCSEASVRAREKLNCQSDVPYGSNSREKMDIFKPSSTDNPQTVFVFVHGGYWQSCSKDEYSFLAVPLTSHGVVTVIVGYSLSPEATIDDMINEVQNAIAFIGEKFSGCSLYLCGHSAGAHLCAMMMCRRWEVESKVPSMIKGMFFISGVFHLAPLISTYINEPLKLNKDDAERISPLIILQAERPSIICPILLAVGEFESPAFKEMSNSLSVILKKHGIRSFFATVPQVDHFDIIENLINSDFLLMQEIFKMINVKPELALLA